MIYLIHGSLKTFFWEPGLVIKDQFIFSCQTFLHHLGHFKIPSSHQECLRYLQVLRPLTRLLRPWDGREQMCWSQSFIPQTGGHADIFCVRPHLSPLVSSAALLAGPPRPPVFTGAQPALICHPALACSLAHPSRPCTRRIPAPIPSVFLSHSVCAAARWTAGQPY